MYNILKNIGVVMSFKDGIKKSFEFVAGITALASGEPYSVGKEIVNYTSYEMSEKIAERKAKKRRKTLYRH